jgi:chorismate-pyruvate lyase
MDCFAALAMTTMTGGANKINKDYLARQIPKTSHDAPALLFGDAPDRPVFRPDGVLHIPSNNHLLKGVIRKYEALCYSDPMENLKTLLYTQHSLTQALCEAVGEPVRIDVLRELSRPCTPEEAHCLNDTQLWQRDVVLRASRPLLLARTRISLTQAQGVLKPLTELGNRPLGEWLFTEHDLPKISFEVNETKHQRNSIYQFQGAFIWVQETFI